MSPKILIVDDVPMNVQALESILQGEGFQTLAAYDEMSGLRIARDASPSLILLDVMMPSIGGFETCARLKSDPRTAGIPVIFISALDDVGSKVEGFKIGGVDYISKPVHGEEVLARVRVHLRIEEDNRLRAMEQLRHLQQLRNAQTSILTLPEDCPQASFAVFYRPLEAVGGDFYDVAEIDPNVFGYFVADVSGHGTKAAFLTSAVKALLRQYAGPLYSPEDTMRGIDSVMRQMLEDEEYLTACYAHLNRRTKRLSVVSAGHPPAIVVDAAGEPWPVEAEGDPLGMFGTLAIHRREVRVSPGDRLYLYTDGLIEWAGSRRDGTAKLVQACAQYRTQSLKDSVAAIGTDLIRQAGKTTDDVLLLATEIPA